MLFKMIMNYAFESEQILKNPVSKLNFLKDVQKEITYWSLAECKRFLKLVKDDHYHDFYLLTLNTGLRLGEVTGLCWDCIDFDRRIIEIKRSMSSNGLQESTKSKRIRFVPMNNEIYNILISRSKKKESLQFVFTSPNSSQVNYRHFTERVFKVKLKELNLRSIKFHDLRSTFASNFCMQGGDIFSLSKILGHSSVAITQDRYAFLNHEFLQEQMTNFSISNTNSPILALTDQATG